MINNGKYYINNVIVKDELTNKIHDIVIKIYKTFFM